jgi:hypothetical protein
MYDMKLEAMTLTELHEETNRLQKMIIDGRPSDAMIRQITGFMQQVDQRIAEVMYIERFKKNQKKTEEVLEIGYTEEVVYTPDYTKNELLDALVFEYKQGDQSEEDSNGEKS